MPESKREMNALRVLFVFSGNHQKVFSENHEKNDVSPLVVEQGRSFAHANVQVNFFAIKGRFLGGYFSNILSLRKEVNKGQYHIVHAHYVLSAWTAVLSMPRVPIVLSLMGEDATGRLLPNGRISLPSRALTLLTLLIQPFVSHIISKSKNIEKYVWRKSISSIVPNGVDISRFTPPDNLNDDGTKRVLFLGSKSDPNKNYQLLQSAMNFVRTENVELIAPYPIDFDDVVELMRTMDLLVMCSLSEGSPNVVKEAMACNLKAVLSDVGDVRYLVDGVKGYEIVSNEPVALAMAIDRVLATDGCDGRERLIELRLSQSDVASRIRSIYDTLV